MVKIENDNINYLKPTGVQNIINKFCYVIGMLPSSYKLALTYEEQILVIGKYLEETVIPALNNNAEAVLQLQNLFIALKDFVENYFDNLDVQDEINNKLNQMEQDGTLDNIINQQIFGEIEENIENIKQNYDKVFNTSEEMKLDTTLKNGMKIKTLGYYEINDGGGANYIIDDSVDETFYQENIQNNLKANLIFSKNLYVEQIGMKGDNDFDNTLLFNNLINLLSDKKILINSLPNKIYKISDNLNFNNLMLNFNNSQINSQNNTITINSSHIENINFYNTKIILSGGKNYFHNILFSEWYETALKINNSYEDFIDLIRFENNKNSIYTVGIECNSSDETLTNIYGYGAFKGIIANASDCYFENVHLWLNNQNVFENSCFIVLNESLNTFTNCCSDSYNFMIYINKTYLRNIIRDCYFINNNNLFNNKSFILINGNVENNIIDGSIALKLTGFSQNNNNLQINYPSNLILRFIDGQPIDPVYFNYQKIKNSSSDNITVQEKSSINITNGKLYINLSIFSSGTSSITFDLSSLPGIINYNFTDFITAMFQNYTVYDTLKISLSNGILKFEIPNRVSQTSISEVHYVATL